MRKIGFWMAMTGVCVLAMTAGGCMEEKTTMSLKFSPDETSTYKVITESVKDYNYVQPSINQTKKQQTLSRTEVVYDQKIDSVDGSGNAKALITIKEVNYHSKSANGGSFDFESAKDTKGSMGKLVGQSYVIKMLPDGEVAAVENAQKIRNAVRGDSKELKIAQSLVGDDAIKQRHTIVALPTAKESAVKQGKSWSSVKAAPAGMLMPKSYEKVFTLKEVKDEHGQKIAVVAMKAQPTSAKAADMPENAASGMGFFGKMFDTKEETYTGEMLMNLNTGKVSSYSEKLKSEMVAVESAKEQIGDKGPDVLTMGFTYIYSVEKMK